MHKVNENSIQKVHKENINTMIHYSKSKKKEESQKYNALKILLFWIVFSLQMYI